MPGKVSARKTKKIIKRQRMAYSKTVPRKRKVQVNTILRKGKRRRHVDVFLRGFFVIAGETRSKSVRGIHLVSKKAAEAEKGDVNDKRRRGWV